MAIDSYESFTASSRHLPSLGLIRGEQSRSSRTDTSCPLLQRATSRVSPTMGSTRLRIKDLTKIGDSGGSVTRTLKIPISSGRCRANRESRSDEHGDGDWKWVWVYQSEVEKMIPALSDIMKTELEHATVEEGQTVIRIDPASPGVMEFFEYHSLTAQEDERPPTPASTPIGIRFYQSSSPSPPAYTIDHPLVLFVPDAFTTGETCITLNSHLSPEILPPLISALRQVEGAKSVRAWGLERDHLLVEELTKRGAKYESRTKSKHIPFGVAWYGPKGTSARVDGLEMWTWT